MELKVWWLGAYEDHNGDFQSIAIIRPTGTLGRIDLDITIGTSIVSMCNGKIWIKQDMGPTREFGLRHMSAKINELEDSGFVEISKEEHEKKYSLQDLNDFLNDFEGAYLIMKLQYV